MALSFDTLKNGLQRIWLPGERGPWPSTARESGDHFATAVAQWFGAAQAATAPCLTAAAKQPAL
ncbi:MAG: hypothetical protein JWM10_367, partial [Myxococcaceae bacterium]|nr:hypothetical protein [Myxococcaceae bacterium]